MSTRYFTNLNYTLGDEDTMVEYEVLPMHVDHVVSVAGSGGRVLPLLAKNPRELTCIDLLSEQLFMTELRMQALKQFEFDEYRAFMGYPPQPMSPEERAASFKKLELSINAYLYLKMLFEKYEWGSIIYMGKFEKALITLSKINNLIIGSKGRDLFHQLSLEEQVTYYKTKFPKNKWKIVLFLLGNSFILNSLLYKGDFPKKNIRGSHYANFKRIFEHIFLTIDVNESFFAQMSFHGKLINPKGNMIEVNETIFEKAKEGVRNCKINYCQGDVVSEIANLASNSVDFISLSDVPSFLKGEMADNYLQKIKKTVSPKGTVMVRGYLRVTKPHQEGYNKVNTDFLHLFKKETTQLWNIDVYKKI